MNITIEEIFKATGQPYLYLKAPFLMPMHQSSMNVHKKFAGKCKPCMKRAYVASMNAIGSAFCNLTLQESTKQPNQLAALKAALNTILNREIKEVIISYKVKNEDKEVRF